jgi:hypothetical protein
MQQAINIETNSDNFVISISRNAIDQTTLFKLVARLRLEYLLNKGAIDENIEQISEEIKTEWWQRNEEFYKKYDV